MIKSDIDFLLGIISNIKNKKLVSSEDFEKAQNLLLDERIEITKKSSNIFEADPFL